MTQAQSCFFSVTTHTSNLSASSSPPTSPSPKPKTASMKTQFPEIGFKGCREKATPLDSDATITCRERCSAKKTAHAHMPTPTHTPTQQYLNNDGHFDSSGGQANLQPVGHDSWGEAGGPAAAQGVQHRLSTTLEQEGLKLTCRAQQQNTSSPLTENRLEQHWEGAHKTPDAELSSHPHPTPLQTPPATPPPPC